MKKTKKSRRALVSLPDGVWKVIDEQVKDALGHGDSEVIRGIVMAYLLERGYLLKPREKSASRDQIAGELDVHDSMITSLAEVLEQKGILTQEEWEKKIKAKIEKPVTNSKYGAGEQ
jgi:metal-responsive CopG/Arc/MetJ family transcriptional regulator